MDHLSVTPADRSSFVHPVTDVGWALAVGYLLTLLPVAAFAAHAYLAKPHPADGGPALLPRTAHTCRGPGPAPPSDGI